MGIKVGIDPYQPGHGAQGTADTFPSTYSNRMITPDYQKTFSGANSGLRFVGQPTKEISQRLGTGEIRPYWLPYFGI